MEGIEITGLGLIKENEQGSMFQFPNRDSPELLLVKKKKGSVFAQKYHTGKDPGKFPKTIVILDGEVEVFLKNIKTKEEFKEIYKKPVILKIDPYIYHQFTALTDTLVLDMHSVEYYKDDTVKGLK